MNARACVCEVGVFMMDRVLGGFYPFSDIRLGQFRPLKIFVSDIIEFFTLTI